ncbi:MAG: SpoIID/LytB domain-containing protein [Gemmatimonadaceae bacterium]|nr:SpoIID/LytB domain-containing protein [Gemmatimonadaceae bacterium]
MPSASRRRKRATRLLVLSAAFSAVATAVAAQERLDSLVESSHSTLRLGDKTIRILLGRTTVMPVSRDALSGTATWGDKRYRGTIEYLPDGSGLAVVNRVDLEDYLRGVLPGEIGSRDPRDRAALQAQAVAARSYAAARMGERRGVYDVTATVADQVYGGMNSERPETDEAVRATRGLVLTWGDRIITAPYHSHGGPMTAAADEVFRRRGGEPYLRPVDDRAPGGGCYCDASGTRGWERRFTRVEIRQLLAQYGRDVGITATGDVRAVSIVARGPSNRVITLAIQTADATTHVQGNDIRHVFRTNGAILPSTNFSIDFDGNILVVRGVGNGHGVGMSQWGAIGRARAGQDARSILAAYYPGTRLSPLL